MQEFKITPSVKELAIEFCGWDEEQQAEFFNQIAKLVMEWDKPFCLQLHKVMTSDTLTYDGRWIMEQIGIYSNPDNK